MPAGVIRVLQLITITLMWIFTCGVLVFVPWLVYVAARWNDALNWSIVIAAVFLPVYIIVAATLTYVYFGLRRGLPRGGAPDATGSGSTKSG